MAVSAAPLLIKAGPRAARQSAICGRLYAFCGTCGQPLVPCPAGGDDAVMRGPRYIGFHPCCPRPGCGGDPDPTMGSRDEPIYL